jgi:hypothetical protein
MRRLSCLIVLLLATLLAAPGRAHSASSQVAALQLVLFERGYYRGPLDGVAGPLTRRATKHFQRRHHLQVDGVAGPQTRRKLGRWALHKLGARLLRRGLSGWDVAELQFLLRKHGAFVSLDGGFGPITEAAVIGVQRAARLAVDGLVGPRTLAAIRNRRSWLQHIKTAVAVSTQIDRWSRQYGVETKLARALAWMESGNQPDLTSSTGAWGVYQIQPATWLYVEQVLAGRGFPRSVEGNVRVGILYLRHLLRDFHGNLRLALGAWYTGPGRVRRHGLSREAQLFVHDVLAIRARY